MTKKFYESIDLKGNDVDDVQSLQLTQDAAADDQAVRKLQAETISALAVQAKIVGSAAQASSDTSFSSSYTNAALSTKQPNMQIDHSSTAYLEIVDGYKIKLKDLGIVSTHKASETSLAAFISASTFNGNGTVTHDGEVLDAMTFIFMEGAVLPQERSVIYLGSNNGTSADFVTFSVDYNTQEIRSYFSATGTGLVYSASTGQYSVAYGNNASELGAHSVPVDPNEFNVVTGSTVLALLKAIEAYVTQVDADATGGSATTNTRLDNMSGVTGNHMGAFAGSILSDNASLKTLIQECENALAAGTTDRAAIRSEVASSVATLTGAVNSEASARAGADNVLTASIATEASLWRSANSQQTSSLNAESNARQTADNALDARLDIVEGDAGTAGSIEKAKADAIASSNATAAAALSSENSRAVLAEAALDLKVDNLAEGNIRYIGNIAGSQTVSMRAAQIAVESPSSRNGLDFKDVYANAGEIFVCTVDQTVVFDDSSSLVLENGDRLLAVEDVTAGSMTASDWSVVQADSSALSVANLDAARIEKTVGGHLDIVPNSVGRDQLSVAIEADIDDRQSLTSNNAIVSEQDTHFYTSSDVGAQQNVYWKRNQVSSSALTGTVRAILAELYVSSNGSGNPLAPSYANAQTCAAHYNGSCVDFSLILSGANFESNAAAGSAIQATGVWARADAPQLGTNIGLTAIGDGAASSNVGIVGFAGDTGTGKDRGGIFAVSSLDVLVYSGTRAADAFPHNDVALVADAKYGPAGSLALYSYGDVHMDGGKCEVENAPTTDKGVMRRADVKSLERVYSFDLVDGVAKNITCSLDLDKSLVQAFHADQDNVELEITRDDANSQLVVKATGQNLTGVRLLVRELSCDVTSV